MGPYKHSVIKKSYKKEIDKWRKHTTPSLGPNKQDFCHCDTDGPYWLLPSVSWCMCQGTNKQRSFNFLRTSASLGLHCWHVLLELLAVHLPAHTSTHSSLLPLWSYILLFEFHMSLQVFPVVLQLIYLELSPLPTQQRCSVYYYSLPASAPQLSHLELLEHGLFNS